MLAQRVRVYDAASGKSTSDCLTYLLKAATRISTFSSLLLLPSPAMSSEDFRVITPASLLDTDLYKVLHAQLNIQMY